MCEGNVFVTGGKVVAVVMVPETNPLRDVWMFPKLSWDPFLSLVYLLRVLQAS